MTIKQHEHIYKYSPGIHQQSMNHSEPYDFSNTHMLFPHPAYHLSPSFQYKAFVSHDSNLHAAHPIKRQAIPKESSNPLLKAHSIIIMCKSTMASKI